jgi:hypothetical protein
MDWSDPDMMPCSCGSRNVTTIAPAAQHTEWRCSQCGKLLGEAFTGIDERESAGPSEFGMSAAQWQRKWPTKFWAQLVRRVSDGEVTIDLRKFASKLARFVPGAADRKAPGRPRGGPFQSREHCLTWLRKFVPTCIKEDWPVTKERIGQLGGGSKYLRTTDPESAAKTITRWCAIYDINFEEDVKKYFQR